MKKPTLEQVKAAKAAYHRNNPGKSWEDDTTFPERLGWLARIGYRAA